MPQAGVMSFPRLTTTSLQLLQLLQPPPWQSNQYVYSLYLRITWLTRHRSVHRAYTHASPIYSPTGPPTRCVPPPCLSRHIFNPDCRGSHKANRANRSRRCLVVQRPRRRGSRMRLWRPCHHYWKIDTHDGSRCRLGCAGQRVIRSIMIMWYGSLRRRRGGIGWGDWGRG